MFKYALLDYVPQRYLRRASFDTLENDRFILDFKSGRRYATDKASRLIGKALSLMDLKDTVIVCIPAYKDGHCPNIVLPTFGQRYIANQKTYSGFTGVTSESPSCESSSGSTSSPFFFLRLCAICSSIFLMS